MILPVIPDDITLGKLLAFRKVILTHQQVSREWGTTEQVCYLRIYLNFLVLQLGITFFKSFYYD